jgi:excisionase family DNA binding protein
MEEEKLITVPEAAERLGVTQAAVRNAIHDGRIVSTSLYGKRLIAPSDLEAYRLRSQPEGEKRVGRPRKNVFGESVQTREQIQ